MNCQVSGRETRFFISTPREATRTRRSYRCTEGKQHAESLAGSADPDENFAAAQ